jgi:hypothetical protein
MAKAHMAFGQVSFLTYIMGFFMNFELLPIMQIGHK